ncbi:hypothetical protein Poli38472_014166 [Pythium oligandrum]|uniref:Calmodulin n=1 Tax=Pythium oligandrum TaxID=41045 RepID=A0A8K1FKC6_PYTOL|nr:hypothetical protein Poli38472_014166 [Pythium oligandrum]|eukprot:TMW64049.1 hypothetical protein Poli38472_014166 [Pythium oligandrum]
MKTSANQVEDEVHRVLNLVRATKTQVPNSRRDHNVRRHRHGAVGGTQHRERPKSLLHAKMKALTAIYGLESTTTKIGCMPVSSSGLTELDSPVSPDHAVRRELLEARRRVYQAHFSGLNAVYGPSGRPKLETLVDAALDAKRSSSKHVVLRIGAAVLTSGNRILSSGQLSSLQDAKYDVCAERAVLLQVLQHRQSNSSEIVEAMVIASDQRNGLLPAPCGSCREFMAEFGDFPVYLLNADMDSQETRSFTLFPNARDTSHAAASKETVNPTVFTSSSLDLSSSKKTSRPTKRPEDIRDWSIEQVVNWLSDTVELPQYRAMFELKQVDGAVLVHLTDADLQLLLDMAHPLHRRRLLLHIDRLKDRELLDHGLNFNQLQDYLAVLDRDRLSVIAELKTTFDRLDGDHDGFVDVADVIKSLGCDTASPVMAELRRSGDGRVSFPMFVQAMATLAQLPTTETCSIPVSALPTIDFVSLRATFDKADANKSGSIDEKELVLLLQSLGRDNCERRAREWFKAVDVNEDGRLSFAEFVLRYTQLTKVDPTPWKTRFEALEPLGTSLKPIAGLNKALALIYPQLPTHEIRSWCEQRLWMEPTQSKSETIGYADFVLACLLFHDTQQQRRAHLRSTLGNDALAHRSRIVQLQQSGHVLLCRQPEGKDTRPTSPGRRRGNNHDEEDEKADEDNAKEKEETRVVDTFNRFARVPTRPRRRNHEKDQKGESSDDEDEEEDEHCLSAVEAAQALTELDIVCSREQLLRYLDREGFRTTRTIDRKTFLALFKRLRVFQAGDYRMYQRRKGENERDVEWLSRPQLKASEREKAMWEVLSGRAYGKHKNRDDFDSYLWSKTPQKKAQERRRETREELTRGRHKSPRRREHELERISRHSRCRRSVSSSSSSSSSDRRHHHHRSRSRRRPRRSSSASSSSTDSEPRARRSTTPSFRGFVVGDRVLSRSHGHGTILRLYRAYFVADVRFDSGRRLQNIELSSLRHLRPDEEAAKSCPFAVGMTVAVAHKGTKTASRRGTIRRCRTNGTLDVVVNEHGEQELLKRVSPSVVTIVHKPVVFSEGAHVTVKRRHEYARGIITLCRTNGSYDVRLRRKDRQVLKAVAWELLAMDPSKDDDEDDVDEDEDEDDMEAKPPQRRRRDEEEKEEEKEDEPAFERGQRVEARFQGQTKYYPGKIQRVHAREDTYDVLYDDGDEETHVARRLIRAVAAKDEYADDAFESD